MKKIAGPWQLFDGFCSMRVLLDQEPTLENRVAFIEKTPRVRVQPFTTNDAETTKWSYGYKGEPYAHDQHREERAWCDQQLLNMGYTLID